MFFLDIYPNKHSYFRKWFTLSRNKLKSNGVSNSNDFKIIEKKNLVKESLLGFTVDFSQILLTPITEYNWLPDLDGIQKPIPGQTGLAKPKRTSFLAKRKSKSNSLNAKIVSIDWIKTQRIILSTVIFEDFCKELAALCTEHSVV